MIRTQTVGCGFSRNAEAPEDSPPPHAFFSEDGKSGPCAFCDLHRRWIASRNVCQEVLDALVEGRVVSAADGLRGWLNATAGQAPRKEGSGT